MKCLEEPAVLRCSECSATKYLCGLCYQYVHERTIEIEMRL